MSHPLLQRLTDTLGIPVLEEADLDRHVQSRPWTVLFFTEDPARFPETLDVAVVLPELLKAFPLLSAALVARDCEHRLQARYGFSVWPTLVFLKRGRYLGHLSKMLNWEEYITRIPLILACEPEEDASVRIPVLQLVPGKPCNQEG